MSGGNIKSNGGLGAWNSGQRGGDGRGRSKRGRVCVCGVHAMLFVKKKEATRSISYHWLTYEYRLHVLLWRIISH